MNRLATLMGILGAVASTGFAQDSLINSYYVKGSLVSPQGDMRIQTQGGIGRGAEFGMVFGLAGATDLDFAFHLGHLVAPRQKRDDIETFTTKGSSFGLDIRYHLPLNLKIIAGPVLTSWDVTGSRRGAAGDSSYKIGFRAGVEHFFRQNMGVGITFLASEWQSKNEENKEAGINPSNPSCLTFSFIYKF